MLSKERFLLGQGVAALAPTLMLLLGCTGTAGDSPGTGGSSVDVDGGTGTGTGGGGGTGGSTVGGSGGRASASGGSTVGGSGGRASASGGAPGAGTGGRSTGPGSGGNSGGGGASTATRPAYNTGTGFFVANGKLYDAQGIEFRIRGVNKLHWDVSSPGIPKTHANTERWVIDFSQPTATNLGLMQQSVSNHVVPMPGNWQGTCDETTTTLTSIVDRWVAQASAWQSLERYMIINIANEWGPAGTAWRDAYITAVGRLRAAGYRATISITSGGCGQNNDDLANYAAAVFNSDPQKNIIFDQHIYGLWSNGAGQSWQTDLAAGLDKLVATGLPVIVGEFGPGRNIGPSPTPVTPGEIIQACEARGIGWMAWAWDDQSTPPDDQWFGLSFSGNYSSTSDLTTFGKVVVENPTYGLLTLARPATIF